ncbi:arylesterase [Mucilaginibacter hurinus]|uniref:Arylesterase n=1 Tax=Mucilaginibacter hurinus TaxID=2201324 RepID=A0A367GLZ8_9SPHI|nr:arylesterase [Mucilaginibacter hurinus]RCH54038.1 arylesterase [Mucilaginibacter hurinus]
MKRVLFFGDSLTAGYGLSDVNEAFPALIQQRIFAEKLQYEVINAGLSGDTSGGGLARLSYWLNNPVDVFVLELGINDALRGIAPATTQKNLQAIINRVKDKYPNAKMAMMGMELPAFIPGQHVAAFRSIFKQVADANNMAFVPFFLEGVAGQRHLNLRDGLHPSAAGYRIIAEKVWPVLRAIL